MAAPADTTARPASAPAFTTQDYERRMHRATAAAARAGLAGVLVTPGPDLVWLTGYRPTAITERVTMLVLTPEREPILVVPTLERPDAEAAAGAAATSIVEWKDGSDPYPVIGRFLRVGSYGVSDSAWALHVLALVEHLPSTRYRPLTTCLPMLRAVKDTAELERLAAAGAGADAAYDAILRGAFAGRPETDVAADLAALLRRFGHEQVDFTVVGSGPNGANPHHEAGDRVIEPGDAVVLDFGGLRDGYGSDTTRTVVVGEPSDEMAAVHAVVRRAQQAAFDAVRPGVPCQEIDRVARAIITEAGFGEAFLHRTGHGIGVTTHEPPYLVEGEEQPLVPGMCFSIEPGVYLAGRFGVRIEDIVTVTDDGGVRFNTTSRELQTVH